MTGEPRIAVVLPAYNEARTVSETIAAFHAALPEASVYVIDNNSSDDTAALAGKTLQDLGCAGDVISEPRQGKGNAVRRAFLDVDADVYVLSDADMTYPADRARVLLEPVLDNRADMVVGNRQADGCYAEQNSRPMHSMGNRIVVRLVNWLFGAKLSDVMSGYRVVDRAFARSYPITVEGFEIETDMTLHALDKRFRVTEVPIRYIERPAGSASKLRTYSDGARVIFTIVQILRYYRPMLFFGAISLLLALAAIAAGIPPISDYVRTHFVGHVPLAILASGLAIVAVLTFGIGLILDSIAHQQRRDFERYLLHDRSAGEQAETLVRR
jgi:glycosyltransferase involved in cell wall biosynthesis